MPAAFAIEIQGLAELQSALKELAPAVEHELKSELLRAGEPVARTAQALAVSRIPNMTPPWSQFRVGSLSSLVYVAPKQRGSRYQSRKRPNLAGLLMERSMEPALAANETLVESRVEVALQRVIKGVGF